MAVGRPQGWRPEALRARREARGMVLEQAAEAVRSISSAEFEAPRATFQVVGRHERGETYPGPRYRRAYCLIYDAAETELGFVPATPGTTPTAAAPSTAGPQTDEARRDVAEPAADVTYFASRGAWQAGETVDLLHRLTKEDFALDRRDAARSIFEPSARRGPTRTARTLATRLTWHGTHTSPPDVPGGRSGTRRNRTSRPVVPELGRQVRWRAEAKGSHRPAQRGHGLAT